MHNQFASRFPYVVDDIHYEGREAMEKEEELPKMNSLMRTPFSLGSEMSINWWSSRKVQRSACNAL
ncbi:hypothetical protein Bca4012_010190 [Brassica carinata]